MTRRQRFLEVLRSVTSSIASSKLSSNNYGLKPTRLRVESLEERRVMAAAVTDFTATDTGFVVEFSEAIDPSTLNLYDTESDAMGPADITLTGATSGAIDGSLVVSGTTVTFVATSGLLPADAYTVVLRSAANGFRSADDGELLDGETNASLPSGNGTPGGNFTTSFTVSANSNLVISIPDFARGPSQAAQAGATGSGAALPTGLPVQLSNAAGVTSLTVTLQYDPTLLNITDVELGEDAPEGSQVEVNLSTPGSITFAFFALDPLSSGQASIVELVGTVPANATYGKAHVLSMTSVSVNAGAVAARTDDALHVVAYSGDANANRRYDAEDARLIARVGVGLDTGFVTATPTSTTIGQMLYPLIDPMIIGDVTGAGGISPLDASDVLRKVVGLSVPNLPDLPAAQAPTAIALSNQVLSGTIASGATVGTLSTTDPTANDTFTYTLVSGTGSTNNASFAISGNTLRTAAALTSTGSPYSVRVRTTDASGNTFEQIFSITVNTTNTAPTALNLSSTSFAESVASGATVATLSSTDANAGDTFTYSLVTGAGSTDNASFTVNGSQLILNTTPNFEAKSGYAIRLRTTDAGGLTFERAVTLTVTNTNEAPTAVAISATNVPAGVASGAVVGVLSTTDQDTADTHTYTLVTGTGSTNNAQFTISGNQLRTAASFNATTQSSYSIRVRSTDSAGLNFERIITGNVVNGNVAPNALNLSSSSFAESVTSGTTVATLSSIDANSSDTFTYSLVTGTGSTDNSLFTISGSQLVLNTTPDFETKPSYSIRLRTTDSGGLTFDRVATLTVTNSNDAPTAIAITATNVTSGAAIGTVVGTLSTTDPDTADTHTYTLITGTGSTNNAQFTISGNELRTAAILNATTQSSYSIRVRSTDNAGGTFERIITGSVVNGNTAPTALNLSSTTFSESIATGTTVATLSTTDANSGDTFTYSLITGTGSTDNSLFTISGSQLVLNTTPDFETKPSYSIRLRTTDSGGLTFDRTVTLTVTNTNEAPTAVAISATNVPAGVASGAVVGVLSTTDQDTTDTHTYTLVTGTGSTNNSQFTISGNQLRTAASFNATTQSSYSIRVRSTDSAGLNFERIITGNVVNGNVAPNALNLSSSSFAESVTSGTTVATLSSIDANSSDTFTYSLVTGTGSTDNSLFTISGSQLVLNTTPDFETKPSYSIRLRTTDSGGLTFDRVATLTVTNSNDAPTAIAITATNVTSGAAIGTVVGTLSTTDPDTADTHTYTLITGTGSTNNAQFTISGNELRTAAILNATTQSSYSIRIRSTDNAGGTFERIITGSVVNGNTAPTAMNLSSTTFSESIATGTTVATLSTTDANSGDTFTYSLITGTGSTDNSLFTISGSQLVLNTTPDFETKPSYSIRLRTTDSGGLTFDRAVTLTVTNSNDAPTAIAISATNVTSGAAIGTIVGTLSTTDQDAADTHTYTLITGIGSADNSAFTISGNQLRTAVVLNSNTQSSYTIRVRSTDNAGANFERVITGSVINGNTAPTALNLSAITFAESIATGTTVATLSTTDGNSGDTFTYSLITGTGSTDNSLFTISGNQLILNTTPDFETKPSYSIRLRTTDSGGLTFDRVATLTVTNSNDAPTAIAVSATNVTSGAASGTLVGTLTTTDQDTADTHTYTLVAGEGATDNSAFAISGNELRTAAVLNASTQAGYSIRVRSTDNAGATFDRIITGNVVDVNTAPTALNLSSTTFAESTASGTTIATLSTTDANSGDTFTYSLVTGIGSTDNSLFTISGNQLALNTTPDFETKPSYSIRLRTTDSGGLTFEQAATLTVTNSNEAPTALALSATDIVSGSAIGTLVGTLSTTDPDAADTHTYALVTGEGSTDNAKFTISGNQVLTAVEFDAASQSSYSIRIRSTDAAGELIEQVINGEVTVNGSAPTAINLSSNTFPEDAATGTVIATLSSIDADEGDTFVYSLVTGDGGVDNDTFTISGSQLLLNTAVDFEDQADHSIRVRTTDSTGKTFEQPLTLTVLDRNDAPTAVSISSTDVISNAPAGATVGSFLTTDQDSGDTHTYTLVEGEGSTDNASFTITDNDLVTTAAFDIANQSSYSIRVRSTDAAGASFERVITGNVVVGNLAPTAISLSNSLVAENSGTNSAVGNLATTDPNESDTHTYSLVAGTGDSDNASFVIDGNTLRTATDFNFETKSSYSVRVRSTDSGGLAFEQEFTVSVTNVNEVPTEVTLSKSTVTDGEPTGTLVGTLGSIDPDAADTFTYELVPGDGDTDNASFTIDGTQLLTAFAAALATKSSYSVRVKTTDAAGLSHEQLFTITVVEQNVAPTAITLSQNTIEENSAAGTVIGTLATTDANTSDTFTYTLVAGDGDTNNSSFQVVGSQLQVLQPLDFEALPTFTLRIRSTDAGGLFVEQAFTIDVQNQNENPTSIALSNNSVVENAPLATVVGTLSSTDPDTGDQHTYVLVAGQGDTDNGLFSIVGNELRVAGTLDFEQKAAYSVRVQSEDTGGLLFEQVFTINVTDVNEGASAVSISSHEILNGSPSGTVVGSLSADDPDASDTLTFALVSGEGDTDNASFTISEGELVTAFTADMEVQSSYLVRIRATDTAGLFVETVIPIIVYELPAAPTDISLSNATIAENVAIGTEIGTLTTTDANTVDSHTYTLVSGNGDTDNAAFAISGDLLTTAANLDFETKTSYSIRVRSTDGSSLTFEKVLTISVSNINEAPTSLNLNKSSIADQQPAGTMVGLFATTDPDSGDTFSYSFIAGDGDLDNAKFQIVDGRLLTASSVDAAVQSMYSVRVRSTDAAGLSVDDILEILVSDVNQAPTDIVLTPFSVPETLPVGSVVGTFATTDGNSIDTHTYRLVAGTGDADNDKFSIQGNQLILLSPLDFASQSSLTIRVISEDPYGLSIEIILEVRVQEVLE